MNELHVQRIFDVLKAASPGRVDPRLAVLLSALFVGAAVGLVVARLRPALAPRPARALQDFLDVGVENRAASPDVLSPEMVILARLGLPAEPRVLVYIRYGVPGVAFLLLVLLGYPTAVALVLAALVYVLVNTFLESRWHAFRLEMEQELPIFIARLAGMLHTSTSVIQALEETVQTFPNASPLRIWMERLTLGLRSRGTAFLDEAMQQAGEVSSALRLVVFLMKRMAETGGAGYLNAFVTVSDEIAMKLEARAVADAKANSVKNNVHFLLAMMGLLLLLYMADPEFRSYLEHPLSQAVAVGALVVAAFGYKTITSMLEGAVR